MGASASTAGRPSRIDESLTRDEARALAGSAWDEERYGPFFDDDEPPTRADDPAVPAPMTMACSLLVAPAGGAPEYPCSE